MRFDVDHQSIVIAGECPVGIDHTRSPKRPFARHEAEVDVPRLRPIALIWIACLNVVFDEIRRSVFEIIIRQQSCPDPHVIEDVEKYRRRRSKKDIDTRLKAALNVKMAIGLNLLFIEAALYLAFPSAEIYCLKILRK